MESLTQQWLRQNVQTYAHSGRVYTDVDDVLSRFHTLRPKSDVYTYDDGRTQLLLCIHGLLPISYRNVSYNIPVAVWLPREYPLQPPISYVVPTNDMLVKAGRYVEVSGKCNIMYLQNWARKSEGCSLLPLLEAMQEHFSREPPVYAKPHQTNPPVTNSPSITPALPDTADGYRDRPPPPLPHTVHPVSSLTPVSQDRPTLPPKPETSMRSTIVEPSPPPPPPPLNVGPPQYGFSHVDSPPAPPHYPRPASGPKTWSLSHPPPRPPSVITPLHSSPAYSPEHPSSSSPLNILPVQHPPPQARILQATRPTPNLLDEDSPEISTYVSQTLHAPAPPRPPNPELIHLHTQVFNKLSSEISSLSQALTLDAERLRAHQADLLSGEPAIRDEMARLEAVRDVCRSVAGRVKNIVHQVELNITELRRKGDPEVDELVCSTTIVHNQLITLVAEDNAIEDTIFHLHRALNAGRIDLERFLKSTRLLAEEQFMKRALIEKIQAGLPMGMSIGSDWS